MSHAFRPVEPLIPIRAKLRGALIRAACGLLVLMGLALATQLGCGGGGSSKPTPPPAALTYNANPAIYTKGTAITANMPSHGGGAVSSYSVTPALPAGLALSSSTGVITGTPTVVTATAAYTVTAMNSSGSTTVNLSITVNDIPPSLLSYNPGSSVYSVGSTITPNTPGSSGGAVVSYAVSRALPPGLSLDAVTGVISGTPTSPTATASYTITATNSGGSTTSILTLTVNDIPPSGLVYSANPAIYVVGTPITPNTPSSGGGAVVSYSLYPSPPAGLAFDGHTGVLSGTPTTPRATTIFKVTARNSGGSVIIDLNLTINTNLVAPANLTYGSDPATYTVGLAITPNTPSNTGGVITSYAYIPPPTGHPTLPPGLSLDPATGVVSGTPTQVSAAYPYAIRGSNSAGTTIGHVSITVNDTPPSGLSYATPAATYSVGVSITPNTPTVSGGAVASYSVSPPLPSGLILNSLTGVISGAPTLPTLSATYTVTATNTGGSTSTSLDITVNDVAPSNLSYTYLTATFTVGKTIPQDFASHAGTVNSYSVSPALPAGITLDTTTGRIFGNPTTITPQATYTVTATNSIGSGTVDLLFKVIPPLTITVDPANQAVHDSGTATFSVTASGTGALSYQWQQEDVDIPGATAASYTTPVMATPGYLHFRVVVSDTFGSQATSAEALLTVFHGVFMPTGRMNLPRRYHTSTLLPTGKVLIANGRDTSIFAHGGYSSGELYDPALGTFASIDLGIARSHHTATLLPNGKVLLAAGTDVTGARLKSAVLYDPIAGSFGVTGSLVDGRLDHTATLLPNGKVLIAGGLVASTATSAELYDPATGLFAPTGQMNTLRTNHTATLLPNGLVLIAGGNTLSGSPANTLELYDPATGVFTNSLSLSASRQGHTATLLATGKVLIAGGSALPSAELYDPAAGTLTPTGDMGFVRTGAAAALLADGRVLIVGGSFRFSAEVYDPATGTFSPTQDTNTNDLGRAATLLPSGKVLVTGGDDPPSGSTTLGDAELFDPQ